VHALTTSNPGIITSYPCWQHAAQYVSGLGSFVHMCCLQAIYLYQSLKQRALHRPSTQEVATTNSICLHNDAVQVPSNLNAKKLAQSCCVALPQSSIQASAHSTTRSQSLRLATICITHAIGVASRSVKEAPVTRHRLICPAIRGGS